MCFWRSHDNQGTITLTRKKPTYRTCDEIYFYVQYRQYFLTKFRENIKTRNPRVGLQPKFGWGNGPGTSNDLDTFGCP